MNPRRKTRLAIVLAVLLGGAATAGLVLYALGQNIDLFFTPGQLHSGKDGVKPQPGQRLRIGGLVVPGTVVRDNQSLDVTFELTDDSGERVKVHYAGILPDLFREGQGIVAQGRLTVAGAVEATEVLAKHDENYMPPEVAEAAKEMHRRGVNGS
ncbi:cytochrome c maturation protein CcmE [Gallaecimonas xiamenensis]|uniref:Cytochrome c-type biogenesis protein CcmE n=1 Tax=Gallaecimonas xiamenensis 3-C-1 TaxID=745411 RepID=K2IY24_9GAMM|nr:cytochrome c maturation protein CcmE [Gallaecimonas xiamenensis]EKE75386.1 cytochrome c-type biogenesis protein CcmE [Gallaecimonas xiamenensis 3-C-1]